MIYYADNALLPAFDKIIREAESQIKELTNLEFSLSIKLPDDGCNPFALEMMVLLCEMFDVKWKDVASKTRKKPIPFVRQLFSYFLKEYTDYSLVGIGGILKCDHTSIIHNINTIKGFLRVKDEQTIKAVDSLVFSLHKPKKEAVA